jgi:hypothetical protein
MRYIPITVAIIGIVIHSLGLLDLIPHPLFILDLLMLCIDILVAYGLIKKTTWGILACDRFISTTKLYAALLGL